MIRGALFDMDGVLVDNTPVHVEAFARFCERYGVTDWRGKLAASYGMGNDDILRRLLPPELIRERGIESLAAEKERIYREIYAPSIRPVAGLRELLEQICAKHSLQNIAKSIISFMNPIYWRKRLPSNLAVL